uniref:Uncharacterized protein n=1 Tax=Anopheles atroparvus TaxID=41427 RepID=A0A182ISJ2_ANOAO
MERLELTEAYFDTHEISIVMFPYSLRSLVLHSVPYASLATRFGFKKLEVLDLRDTPISDSDVSCFNIVHSLKELLLECPEHLRTEQGLQEYNEAERQRVEQLHRLAAPDRIQNNGAGHGHGVNQPAPREQFTYDSMGFQIELQITINKCNNSNKIRSNKIIPLLNASSHT